MLNTRNRTLATHFGTAFVMLSSMLLSGCSTDNATTDDYALNDQFYERYPIRVESAPVNLGVGTHGGTLQAEQASAVAAFGRDARHNSQSRISLRYPSGSAHGRAIASEVGQILVEQGVSPRRIHVSSYPGGASAPIQLSFVRKVAVTRECGDWSRDLGTTYDNRSPPNFGCANQNNIAAMVANPEDFEHPRAMTPVAGSSRMAALILYFGGGTASSAAGGGTGGGSGGGSGGGGSGGGSGG